MKYKTKLIPIVIAVMLIFITGIQCVTAEKSVDTEIQISRISGGIGQVSYDIENIGDIPAEGITSSISIKGGILEKIDVFHECSGCGHCNNTIDPGAIKTESSSEGGFIFGIGPIDINIAASATNAAEVNTSASGFVIGIFVIIQ